MARLFTAIEIPQPLAQQLAKLQPRAILGVRLVKTEQIHLTLHFLGETSLPLVQQALQDFDGKSFSLTIDRVGSFPTAGKTTTLWAGIRASRELLEMHQELETRLMVAGYRPEKRAYHPHVTLARCENDVPRKVIDEFLKQTMVPVEVTVTELVLFSSTLSPLGPTYHQEIVIKLR